jgi:hypothetical protein
VSAAGAGHAFEHDLVEVLAESDRRRRDPARPQFPGVPGELGAIGDAVIRQAVAEEQAARDLAVREVLRELFAAFQPAASQIGVSASLWLDSEILT